MALFPWGRAGRWAFKPFTNSIYVSIPPVAAGPSLLISIYLSYSLVPVVKAGWEKPFDIVILAKKITKVH